MKILFSSRQNVSVLPVLVALLFTLFFSPAVGKAQYASSGAGQTPGMGGSDIADIVDQLERSALLALIGIVVFIGLVWIGYVSKECTRLSKPQEDTRRPFMSLLILVAALSVFCGSCTVEQRARAAEYRAAEAAENRTCPAPRHHVNYENAPLNNCYPYNGYSNWKAPTYCNYCGQRIFNRNH